MAYRAPTGEFEFLFEHVVDLSAVTETELFADATPDVTKAILSEAGKLCDEVMAPVQRNGDTNGAVLENGTVRTSPGFADAFEKLPKVAGSRFRPILNMAVWGCRWRCVAL